MLGNFSQLLITLLAGLFFFPFYLSQNSGLLALNTKIWLAAAVIILAIIVLLLVYFNIPSIGKWLSKLKFFKKYNSFVIFVQNYLLKDLLNIIVLSGFRYIVFTFQFFILVKIFGINMAYYTVLIGISQVYLIMAVLPTFALGELGVRGSVAIWVFNIYTTYTTGIVAASILLWIINLAIPALIGIYFLSKLRY